MAGRSVPQYLGLRVQLLCTGQNALRYAYYGCWCGPYNTGGKTLDKLDKLVMQYDLYH